mmetsp:Transcript_11154/g.22510  ORF Transcript_11154/g.22510 Transcript_11154/m.22510 type:complete len:223 (-) Transcript_11154:12-680(-)
MRMRMRRSGRRRALRAGCVLAHSTRTTMRMRTTTTKTTTMRTMRAVRRMSQRRRQLAEVAVVLRPAQGAAHQLLPSRVQQRAAMGQRASERGATESAAGASLLHARSAGGGGRWSMRRSVRCGRSPWWMNGEVAWASPSPWDRSPAACLREGFSVHPGASGPFIPALYTGHRQHISPPRSPHAPSGSYSPCGLYVRLESSGLGSVYNVMDSLCHVALHHFAI